MRARLSSPVALLLRIVGAALLAANAWIHLSLWDGGYSTIHVIGPAFLLDAIAGFGLAIGVLLAPRRLLGWVAVAGALLQLGAFGALMLSVTVGLFGFVETTAAPLFWEMVAVEVAGAAVLVVLARLRVVQAAPHRELERMWG